MESMFLINTTLDQSKPSPVSRKPPKQKKKTTSTKKPIKVRYISNPMRVETCASKFRELVQELTGQNAVDVQQEPVFSSSSTVSDHNTSPPVEDLAPRVLYQEPLDDRVLTEYYYEPLDEEEMLLFQTSTGFTNGFYNVNDFGRIDST